MDAFARGLRNAAKIVEDGVLDMALKVWCYLIPEGRILKCNKVRSSCHCDIYNL